MLIKAPAAEEGIKSPIFCPLILVLSRFLNKMATVKNLYPDNSIPVESATIRLFLTSFIVLNISSGILLSTFICSVHDSIVKSITLCLT